MLLFARSRSQVEVLTRYLKDLAVELNQDLSGLRPELMLIAADGLLVVSDDGAQMRALGKTCKERRRALPNDPEVYSRARWLPLPELQ